MGPILAFNSSLIVKNYDIQFLQIYSILIHRIHGH